MCNVVWSLVDNIAKVFTCTMLSKSIKTTLKIIFSCAMFSGVSCWTTHHKIFTCVMLSPKVLRQDWTGFFPVHCCLEPQGQYWIGFLPAQCCPKSIETTLKRIFSCAMFSGASWTILHKVFTSTMFGPWLTDNFYDKYNLCNVVLTMLDNIALLPSQGYLK